MGDTFITVSHVDDLFYAYDTRCGTTKALLDVTCKEFNMSRNQDDIFFCGRRVRVTTEALFIRQEFAALSLLPMELCGPQRSAKTVLTRTEHREYRSLLGFLQWLQLPSRPDLSYEVNRATQRSVHPRLLMLEPSMHCSQGPATLGNHLMYPQGVVDVSTAHLVTYGDASFAKMDGSKSPVSSYF